MCLYTVLTTLTLLTFTYAQSSADTSTSTSNSTCYWPNGSPAPLTHLIPCPSSLSFDDVFSCCPPSTASDLYPLDYPLCTSNGLCKAGNSDFLARGGCTDSSFSSTSCPQYCPSKMDTGMAGITNCDGKTPFYCCDAQHDDGSCGCGPGAPNGSAFMLDGTQGVGWQRVLDETEAVTVGAGGVESLGASATRMAGSTSAGGSTTVTAMAAATGNTISTMASTENSSSGPNAKSTVVQTVAPSSTASGSSSTSTSATAKSSSGAVPAQRANIMLWVGVTMVILAS